MDFRLHLGTPEGHFGSHVGGRFANRSDYVYFFVCVFPVQEKGAKTELPRGGGMRSAHAGACFVRVGPRRFGSILGSILESFWEPSSPLYSFLVALVAKTGSQKRG